MNSRIDAPTFSTIWWDNAKTIGIYGGAAIGIAAGAPVGTAAYLVGVGLGSPEFGIVAGGITGGVVGLPVAAATGSTLAAMFAVPFAMSAVHTRQFQTNQVIEMSLQSLFSTLENETHYKEQVIQQILAENKQRKLGIRSYESYNLIEGLKEKQTENSQNLLNHQWESLKQYMTATSNGRYIHNGKKLFNMILNIANQLAVKKRILNELMNAIKSGNQSVVTEILATHAHLFMQPGWARRMLIECAINAENGHALKEIIDRCHGEHTDDYHDILTYAINNNKIQMTDLLLGNCQQHYAKVNQLAETIFNRVIKEGQVMMLDMLLSNHRALLHHPNVSPLKLAIMHDKPAIINVLAVKHADINQPLPNGKRPVNYADSLMKHNLAEQLVRLGANDDSYIQLKSDLQQIISLINNPSWSQQGIGFFSRKVPTGVSLFRKIVSDYSEHDFDTMSREMVIKLANTLKIVVRGFEHSATRSESTKSLYRMVSEMGEVKNDSRYAALHVEIDTIDQARRARR